jgi:hypothetical protein
VFDTLHVAQAQVVHVVERVLRFDRRAERIGHHDLAGSAQTAQARCHVHAGAKNIQGVDQDTGGMQPDPDLDALVCRSPLAERQDAPLHGTRHGQRAGFVGELHQAHRIRDINDGYRAPYPRGSFCRSSDVD